MDRMIYLSMSGAKATMQRQDTLANNLANVSTVGFRAELAAFRAVPVEKRRPWVAALLPSFLPDFLVGGEGFEPPTPTV